ncbi:MAG: flagellar M-ring protein FliF [Butyrivibrio sp.]|nr:flagellar M-ring protein FliF [Acetatifactor muris]MCM1558116.1 flagellar M-ring protein FliF [Butyrivibrio sp.]
MPEKLKEILEKIKEWWNKFTAKQRTIIIAIGAAVIFTLVIIVYAISRPEYIKLGTYATSAEAAEVVNILESAGVTHRESDDALTIEVLAEQQYMANLALGSAGYTSASLKYEDWVNSSMSTTSTDREHQWKLYLQAEMAKTLECQNSVKHAEVILTIPPQNGTLAAQNEETSAYITLTLDGVLSSSQAAGLAKCVAAGLGNVAMDKITIVDTDSNLLFAGNDSSSYVGMAQSMLELQAQAQTFLASQVKTVLYGTQQFDQIMVSPHLEVDYSEYQETWKEYSAPDGRDEGLKSHEAEFESSNVNEGGGVPGTDENDGENYTGYMWQDYGTSESSQTERDTDYLPNEYAKRVSTSPGVVKYENSSLSISMIKYRVYNEETVKAQGLLEGITWEEFQEAHREDVRLEVDQEYYRTAAFATGISEDRISILAYESPIFNDKEGLSVTATDIVSIVMIVLILALLAFVVLRSMRSRKAEAEEEELSVESMLQSTPEEVNNIDVETKSDTRKMIEKFVDDNPEAAANLLRNWLNEDWG